MESVFTYAEQAKTLTEVNFTSLHAGFFLLKRPQVTLNGGPDAEKIEFVTTYAPSGVDPFASEWLIETLKKRPGNPYPERIAIGRATNCDVVLRVPFISKVHAHILLEPSQAPALRDNKAANSTFHNGVKLPSGGSCSLSVGDFVAFGALQFEFIDAGRLYHVLRIDFRREQTSSGSRPTR